MRNINHSMLFASARERLRDWLEDPWCSCTCGPATLQRSAGRTNPLRSRICKNLNLHPFTDLRETEEESDATHKPQNLARVFLHDAGTRPARRWRAAKAGLKERRRQMRHENRIDQRFNPSRSESSEEGRTEETRLIWFGREKEPHNLTHSSTGAVGVEAGEAATVEGFLHVLLSGLRFVPPNLQQLILGRGKGRWRDVGLKTEFEKRK